nr:calreticulin 1b [Tanacetum cinerariifolium]
MDLFAFINHVDPTKVRIGEREVAEGELVELLKSCDYRILAIGDGGNDVRMIQQADIGVGPEDWDDKEFIADPEDKKPEGYDDIKKEIPDPDARKGRPAKTPLKVLRLLLFGASSCPEESSNSKEALHELRASLCTCLTNGMILPLQA